MKRILAVIRSERQSYIEMAAVMLGLMVLLTAMEIGGILFFNEQEFAPLSVIGTSSIGVMIMMLVSGLEFSLIYNRALRYGVTRKKALVGAVGSNLVLGLIFWAVILLSLCIEALICYVVFFSELRVQQIAEFFASGFLPMLPALVGGTLVVNMIWGTIAGVLLMKYGKAIFWGWYVIFFGGMFLMIILEENPLLNRLMSKIPPLSPIHWMILGAVVVVALLVYAVRTAFRLEVRETFG